MADTDPRLNTPDCPRSGCGAKAGDPQCYSATGFPVPMHKVRLHGAAREKVAGRLAHRRPSDKQYLILAAAVDAGGMYELSGYRFAGDAQRRAAMTAMVDVERGWFVRLRDTQHGTLYEITDAGRNAYYRYVDWMDGR